MEILQLPDSRVMYLELMIIWEKVALKKMLSTSPFLNGRADSTLLNLIYLNSTEQPAIAVIDNVYYTTHIILYT